MHFNHNLAPHPRQSVTPAVGEDRVRERAFKFIQQIEGFWHERGFAEVRVTIRPEVIVAKAHGRVFEICSNLINGLPPSKAGGPRELRSSRPSP